MRATSDEGPGPAFATSGGQSGRLSSAAQVEGEPTTQNRSVGGAPTLVVWVERVRNERGRPVAIFAALDGDDPPLPEMALDVAVAPLAGGTPVVAPMAPFGTGRRFRTLFEPDAAATVATGDERSTSPPVAFHYLVRARTSGADPIERTAGGVFSIHDPAARFHAASLRARHAGPGVVVTAEIAVLRGGTFWAYAELWGGPAADRPIAFARRPLGRLAPGRHPIELSFAGDAIGAAGLPPPYTVRNVRLKQVDTHPPHEADPVATVPVDPSE